MREWGTFGFQRSGRDTELRAKLSHLALNNALNYLFSCNIDEHIVRIINNYAYYLLAALVTIHLDLLVVFARLLRLSPQRHWETMPTL